MEESLLNENENKNKKELEERKREKAVESWGCKDKDIYLHANIISKIFFWWSFRIIKLANVLPLQSEYLGKLEGPNQSGNYINNIRKIWEDKGYKTLKRMALLRAIMRANIGSVIFMLTFNFICALLEFASVYLFRVYIKLYQDDYIPPYEFYTKMNIGIIFLTIKVLSAFISRQANIYQNLLGYKSGIELNCMIFNKVLKTSPASTKEKSTEGEIVNFLQVDSTKLAMVMMSSPALFIIPIQIVVYTYMLFDTMGISFLFGFVTLLIFLSLNFFIQSRYRILQKEMLKKKDARMKVTTETFNGLKVFKLYAWEEEFLKRIEITRNEELATMRKIFNYSNFNLTMLWFAPVAVATASIGAYQYFEPEMKIAEIFTALNIFNQIQEPIRSLPWVFSNLLELIVSMKRIEKFLSQDEIDPNRVKEGTGNIEDNGVEDNSIAIKVENANFSWGVESDGKAKKGDANNQSNNPDKTDYKSSTTNIKEEKTIPSRSITEKEENTKLVINTNSIISNDNTNNSNVNLGININESKLDKNNEVIAIEINPSEISPKVVLKNINLTINKGDFICIIGEVGSGKSSLLQAILNNMLPAQSFPDKQPTIIINGTTSYVSQVPWIQNDTVRNNIIFNSTYEEAKYKRVIEICELKPDLEVLVGGDMTEIGEKGINLSGGQKARISIARAIYAESDIYLLDDPISALDAHVGQNIMRNCIVDHLSKTTRVLVTHAVQYLQYADRVIYMQNGSIVWEGVYSDLVAQDFFQDFRVKLKRKESAPMEEVDSAKVVDKEEKKQEQEVKRITKDEDKEEGQVKKAVYLKYIDYMGGWCVFFIVALVMATWQVLRSGSDVWLTKWSKLQDPSQNLHNFIIYAALGTSSAFFVLMRVCILTRGSLKSSKRLHSEMIDKLVHAPINLFHDTIPKGQILNRLSKDLSSMDGFTMFMYGSVFSYFFVFLGCIVICAIVEKYSLIPLPLLFISGWFISRFYISASRDLSRLDGTTRSPIINLLAETIPGSTTIRAFKQQHIFSEKFYSRADEYYKVRMLYVGVNQWFGLTLDLLSVSFLVFLIVFTNLFAYSPQAIGLMLTYSLSLQDNLFRLLMFTSNFENCMVSMERCLKYTTVPSEAAYTLPIDSELTEWPLYGTVKFVDYSVRYRPDTDLVLKNLNFTIKPGEKVGVVGRTGSGKSTLCLALFRIIEPSAGSIFIDDVDITQVGLKKLRSSLTIIPQDPNLMHGTLKYNIDPLGLYSEETIKEVMEMIGFWYICENNPKGLEQIVTESGNNLSVGEKQLICITRAILRKSKIVVMDEATANIDFKTEEIIQKATNLILKNSTVITIAHRIKTILHYDRILVLRNGEIVEFDSPDNLINDTNSLFYELYKRSH